MWTKSSLWTNLEHRPFLEWQPCHSSILGILLLNTNLLYSAVFLLYIHNQFGFSLVIVVLQVFRSSLLCKNMLFLLWLMVGSDFVWGSLNECVGKSMFYQVMHIIDCLPPYYQNTSLSTGENWILTIVWLKNNTSPYINF